MSGEANVRSRNETDQHRDGAPPPAEHEPQIIARAGGFDWADRTGPGRAARSVVVIASGISSQLRRRRRRRGRLRRCSTPKKNPAGCCGGGGGDGGDTGGRRSSLDGGPSEGDGDQRLGSRSNEISAVLSVEVVAAPCRVLQGESVRCTPIRLFFQPRRNSRDLRHGGDALSVTAPSRYRPTPHATVSLPTSAAASCCLFFQSSQDDAAALVGMPNLACSVGRYRFKVVTDSKSPPRRKPTEFFRLHVICSADEEKISVEISQRV